MKSTQKHVENIYKTTLENGGKETLLVRMPEKLVKNLNWKEGQNMEIEYVESCTDEGEFHALCVTNITLGQINK